LLSLIVLNLLLNSVYNGGGVSDVILSTVVTTIMLEAYCFAAV